MTTTHTAETLLQLADLEAGPETTDPGYVEARRRVIACWDAREGLPTAVIEGARVTAMARDTTMSTTKPRRIRMAQCPYCGFAFKWKRKGPQDLHHILQCPMCFICMAAKEVKTWLEATA